MIMMIELSVEVLIGLLCSFFTAIWLFWKFTEHRREKESDRRWEDLHRLLDSRFADISETQRRAMEGWRSQEIALLELKAELPREYVSKPDFINMMSKLEGKMDMLALRFENAQLKGNPHA